MRDQHRNPDGRRKRLRRSRREREHHEIHHQPNQHTIKRTGDPRSFQEERPPATRGVENRRRADRDDEVQSEAERGRRGTTFARRLGADQPRRDAMENLRRPHALHRDREVADHIENIEPPGDQPGHRDATKRSRRAQRPAIPHGFSVAVSFQ